MTDVSTRIDEIVKKSDIVLFMKGTALFPQCGFSSRAVAILDHLGVAFETVDVLQDPEIRQGIKDYSDWPTVPAALRQGRVRRRLRHHDGDVRGRRAPAAADREAGRARLRRQIPCSGVDRTVDRKVELVAQRSGLAGARGGIRRQPPPPS